MFARWKSDGANAPELPRNSAKRSSLVAVQLVVAHVRVVVTVDGMEPHHAHFSSSSLLGSREVSELLGMSREQVWRLWTSGRLPGYRFDRHLRFAPADVDRFMALHYSQQGGAAASPQARRRTRLDYAPI